MSAIEARELLTRRVGDRADAEPEAVDQIIAACAGLPLALAIAASRARQASFPLATLAAELDAADQRLDALDAGEPISQVRAVISWSYTTLSPPAARLFRLLGLHPGPDTSAIAAANLAGLALPAARRLLIELARANLMTEHTAGRYSFHDLLRAYATEQAHRYETEQQRRDALTRLFDCYLAGAAAAMDALFPAEARYRPSVPVPAGPVARMPGPPVARDWLDAERATLAAVATHARDHGWPGHAHHAGLDPVPLPPGRRAPPRGQGDIGRCAGLRPADRGSRRPSRGAQASRLPRHRAPPSHARHR